MYLFGPHRPNFALNAIRLIETSTEADQLIAHLAHFAIHMVVAKVRMGADAGNLGVLRVDTERILFLATLDTLL